MRLAGAVGSARGCRRRRQQRVRRRRTSGASRASPAPRVWRSLSESRPLLEAVAQLIDTLDLQTLDRSEFVSEAIERDCLPDSTRRTRDEALRRRRTLRAGLSLLASARRVGILGAHLRGRRGLRRRHDAVGQRRLSRRNQSASCRRREPRASRRALSLADFVRSFSVVENSVERMTNDAQPSSPRLPKLDRLAPARAGRAHAARQLSAMPPARRLRSRRNADRSRSRRSRERVREAVARMLEAGIPGCLVTGRMYRASSRSRASSDSRRR